MKKIMFAIMAVLMAAALVVTAGCGNAAANGFRTGTWASAEGVNYVFYEDGKGGRNVSVADGMGVGFEYELSRNGSCVFHMGSADDMTKATVEFIGGGDDTAAITWEDGSRMVLYFVSEDTSDEFADTYVMGEITGEDEVNAPAADDFVGNWHDAVAGRAYMTVTMSDGKPYFEVTWPDSAFAYYMFAFRCEDVDDEGRLVYTEGFKGIVEADEEGNETKTIIDESADGTVELTADGAMIWTEADAQDDPHEFVKD